jgi:hypothetical protein
MMAFSVILLVNALLPDPAVWPLYLGAGGIAALDRLQRPSMNALIPRLMNRDEIPRSACAGPSSPAGCSVPARVGLLAAVLPRFTRYDERTSPHGQARDTEEPAPVSPLGTDV